ncbi:DUF1310 family protein [Enterococcus hirae]|uniref:DUF1310 family protein n=1 Tax=Enterococcus hirae TaxID=1354 RepID=UPI001A95AC87|nr:DUF1310 family protein [Enterococcus hirae]MBO1103654.1 DUF1310 family protein [Enterococcus hirae]
MKKRKLFFYLFIALIIILGGKLYMDNKQLQKEMVTVVKSDEAKKAFEEGLRNLDPNALTPRGVIQSYEIDVDSIKHNPMGGINGTLYINNDLNLVILFHLNKSDGKNLDSTYVISGTSYELSQLLKEEN